MYESHFFYRKTLNGYRPYSKSVLWTAVTLCDISLSYGKAYIHTDPFNILVIGPNLSTCWSNLAMEPVYHFIVL